MRRSFFDYILFFYHDAGSFGSLAHVLENDPALPKEETQEGMFRYLKECGRYTSYHAIIENIYQRYIKTIKGQF